MASQISSRSPPNLAAEEAQVVKDEFSRDSLAFKLMGPTAALAQLQDQLGSTERMLREQLTSFTLPNPPADLLQMLGRIEVSPEITEAFPTLQSAGFSPSIADSLKQLQVTIPADFAGITASFGRLADLTDGLSAKIPSEMREKFAAQLGAGFDDRLQGFASLGEAMRGLARLPIEDLEIIADEVHVEVVAAEAAPERRQMTAWEAFKVLTFFVGWVQFVLGFLPNPQDGQIAKEVRELRQLVERLSASPYLARAATLRVEPTPEAEKVAIAPSGSRVMIVERNGPWALVWYQHGETSDEIRAGWAYYPSLRFSDDPGSGVAAAEPALPREAEEGRGQAPAT